MLNLCCAVLCVLLAVRVVMAFYSNTYAFSDGFRCVALCVLCIVLAVRSVHSWVLRVELVMNQLVLIHIFLGTPCGISDESIGANPHLLGYSVWN